MFDGVLDKNPGWSSWVPEFRINLIIKIDPAGEGVIHPVLHQMNVMLKEIELFSNVRESLSLLGLDDRIRREGQAGSVGLNRVPIQYHGTNGIDGVESEVGIQLVVQQQQLQFGNFFLCIDLLINPCTFANCWTSTTKFSATDAINR